MSDVELPPVSDLLSQLRGVGVTRPEPDFALVAKLADYIEASVAEIAGSIPDSETVSVTKTKISRVLTCEKFQMSLARASVITPELVLGELMDKVFAHVFAGCDPSFDPLKIALEAAIVEDNENLMQRWFELSEQQRETVGDQVRRQGRELRDRWPDLPFVALPRLQNSVRVSWAGGRVAWNGRMDLVLGGASEHVNVTLVDVKSGHNRYNDTTDAEWYALLETLRSGIQPFRTGSYYLADGTLDLELVTGGMLRRAAERAVDATARLVRLAAGALPEVTPNHLCGWCPALAGCVPGQDSLRKEDEHAS